MEHHNSFIRALCWTLLLEDVPDSGLDKAPARDLEWRHERAVPMEQFPV